MGIPPQNDGHIGWWNRKYWCSAINWEPPIRKVWMILLFNRDDTVDGQNLVRLGNGEDSANNQVHQIYLLDSICWKSHHCCLTNFGLLSSYHVVSEGVLLSEILSEPLSNGWLPEISYQRLELVSSTCCETSWFLRTGQRMERLGHRSPAGKKRKSWWEHLAHTILWQFNW